MPVLIPVASLTRHCNPYSAIVWEGLLEPVSRGQVRLALEQGLGLSSPVTSDDASGDLHASRIAWLVRHGWNDAIDIDVGIPSLHCFPPWFVQDGNHRLAAAIYRGDPVIRAVVGGDVDYARELFGVDVIEPVEAACA